MKYPMNGTKQKRFQPSVEDYDTENDWEDDIEDTQQELFTPLIQDHYDIRLTPEWKRQYLVERRTGDYRCPQPKPARADSHKSACVWVLVADQEGGSCVKQPSKPMPPDWYLEEQKVPASPKGTEIYEFSLRQNAHQPNAHTKTSIQEKTHNESSVRHIAHRSNTHSKRSPHPERKAVHKEKPKATKVSSDPDEPTASSKPDCHSWKVHPLSSNALEYEQCYNCGLLWGKEEHHICGVEGNVPKPNSTGICRCRLPRKHYVPEALYTRYFCGNTTSALRAELYQGGNLNNSFKVDRTPTYQFVSTPTTGDFAPFSRKLNYKENQDAIRRGTGTALPDTDPCSSKRPEKSDKQRQVITPLIFDITFLMIQHLKTSRDWLANLLQSLSTSSSAINEVSQRSAVYQAKYLCDIEDYVLLFEGPGANGLTPSMWIEALTAYTGIEEDFTNDVWEYFITQCEELTSAKQGLRLLLGLCEKFGIEAERYLEPYGEDLVEGKPVWPWRVMMVGLLADHAVSLAGRLR